MSLEHVSPKWMREWMKRKIWILLITVVLYIFGVMEYVMELPGLVKWEILSFIGPENESFFMITAGTAILCALQGFGYLYSQQKIDFYLGNPVNRKHFFRTEYLASALIGMVPCLFARGLCYFIQPEYTKEMLFAAIAGVLVNFAGYLMIYGITVLVMLLSGSWLMVTVSIPVFLSYGQILFGLIVTKYSALFFKTFYRMDISNRLADCFSPFFAYRELAGIKNSGGIMGWQFAEHKEMTVAVCIYAVMLFIITRKLFLIRPSEAVGRAIAFKRAEKLIKFAVSIPFALLLGFYVMRLSLKEKSFVLLALGIVFGAVLANSILEMLFQADIRAVFARKRDVMICVTAALCIAGSFYADLWQYDKYQPALEEIEEIALSINGMDGAYEEGDSYVTEQKLEKIRLTGEAKERAAKWLLDVKENQKQEASVTDVTVAFQKQDGSCSYRKYMVTMEQLNAFGNIYETEDYKKGTIALLSAERAVNMEFIWENGAEKYRLELSEEEKEELLSIYQEETSKLTFDDIKKENPLSWMRLVRPYEEGGAEGYLYSCHEKTIKFLEEMGIPAGKSIKDYEILGIEKSYQSENGWVIEEVEEPQEIERVREQLVYERLALQPILHQMEDDHLKVRYRRVDGKGTDVVECRMEK